MYLTDLTLDHFRSYAGLSLTLRPGLTLVIGDNATGKSNLLEAIYTLAATRSPRASTEGELIAWDAPHPPVTRIAGAAQRADGPVRVEIALVARTDPQGTVVPAKSGAPLTSKRIRVNGVNRRASDATGQIAAVLFTTLDIEIITGSPSHRRRYLDLTIAQYDRAYARAYSRYDKAVTQRNALLKRIRAGEATAAELAPWDDVLISEGATVVAARADAVKQLAAAANRHHDDVTSFDATATNTPTDAATDTATPTDTATDTATDKATATHTDAGTLDLAYQPALGKAGLPDVATANAVQERLQAALSAERRRELGAGTTLIGPHRDDVAIQLNGHAAAAYASRAQQRSIALALRLAEADLLRARTGEWPILLLDDVFSELDPSRRTATARAIAGAEQVIVSSADAATVPDALPAAVDSYRVADGQLIRIDA